MDIDSYEEYKDKISYVKDKESKYYKKYIIKNLEEFFELIYLHFSTLKNKEIFYRGQGNEKWDLQASIFREDILSLESELLDDLIKSRPKIFSDCKNNTEKLTIIQHYGSPTRLLDITTNPLVALYFACEDKKIKTNGIVHLFEEELKETKEQRDYIDIISNFAFFEDKKSTDIFKDYLKNQGYFYEKNVINTALNKKRILLKSSKNNERIIAQQGNFYLSSNDGRIKGIEENTTIEKKKFEIESERVILIDRLSKKMILKELSVIGIKKSVIYPALENCAKEFIEKHKKKKKYKKNKVKNQEKESKLNIYDKRDKINFLKNKLLENGIKETIINRFIKIIEETIESNDDWLSFESKKSQVKLKIKRFLLKNKVNIDKEEIYNILVGEKEVKNG